MIELILALLCSASMAIALRLSGRTKGSRYGLLVGNYITCVLIAWLSMPEKAIVPANRAMWTAMAAGMFNGFIFLTDLLLFQLNIRKNGAVLATTFSKLGLLIQCIYPLSWGTPDGFADAGDASGIGRDFVNPSGKGGGKSLV